MADGAALCLRRLRAPDSTDFEAVWSLLRDDFQLALEDQGWHDVGMMDSISDLSIGERVNIFSEIVGIQIDGIDLGQVNLWLDLVSSAGGSAEKRRRQFATVPEAVLTVLRIREQVLHSSAPDSISLDP
jgi:hypothetical protein